MRFKILTFDIIALLLQSVIINRNPPEIIGAMLLFIARSVLSQLSVVWPEALKSPAQMSPAEAKPGTSCKKLGSYSDEGLLQWWVSRPLDYKILHYEAWLCLFSSVISLAVLLFSGVTLMVCCHATCTPILRCFKPTLTTCTPIFSCFKPTLMVCCHT